MHLSTFNGQKIVLKCPYCNGDGHLQPGLKVSQNKRNELLYICQNYPRCDAYVGVHVGSLLPLGTMANPRLRTLRRMAHEVFDPLWQDNSNELGRSAAYDAAAAVMGIEGEFHIGNLNERSCEDFIRSISLIEVEMDARLAKHFALGAPPDPVTIEILHVLFHPDRDTFLPFINLNEISMYEREWAEAQRCGLVQTDRFKVMLSPKGQSLIFDATT